MARIREKFNFWWNSKKKYWVSTFFNVIVYISPFVFLQPNIQKFVLDHFKSSIMLMVIIFLINEYLKTEQLSSNEKEKNELRTLSERYENINLFLEGLPKEFLKHVSKFLKLKNSDRISLYVYSKNKFRIIGRYSENPTYNREGRREYPECGYIAKCLRNDDGKNYFSRINLPLTSKKSYYKTVEKESGMKEEDIRKLSMKSRSYFTKVVKDENMNNVGVLVIESTKDRLPMESEELNKKLEDLSVPQMATFLEVSNKLKGDVSCE